MKRRGFVAALIGVWGGLTAVVRAATPTDASDDFVREGWHIQWSGWQQVPNQCLQTGYWTARRDTSGDFIYCTSLGECGHARRFHMLNMTYTREWPVLDGTHTPEQANRVKASALKRLLDTLPQVLA